MGDNETLLPCVPRPDRATARPELSCTSQGAMPPMQCVAARRRRHTVESEPMGRFPQRQRRFSWASTPSGGEREELNVVAIESGRPWSSTVKAETRALRCADVTCRNRGRVVDLSSVQRRCPATSQCPELVGGIASNWIGRPGPDWDKRQCCDARRQEAPDVCGPSLFALMQLGLLTVPNAAVPPAPRDLEFAEAKECV